MAPAYVNLDLAASSPLRDAAIAAQRRYDEGPLAGANPNSLHSLGRRAQAALEDARRRIARSLGGRVRPAEVIFTSGGTEANHLALLGIAEAVRARHPERRRVVVSAIEHDSILDNLSLLRERGFETIEVAPDSHGVITPEALETHLDGACALVSVMLANNETGVVQPVRELAGAAHAAGALFHTDAVQAYLHIPFDVSELGVDALSIAGHKVGGPVSTGVLWLKARTPLAPQVRGGGQEAGRRAGTQDVRGAVALAAVADELHPEVAALREEVAARADALYRALLAHPRIHATMGDPFQVDRLPGIVSIYVDGADSDDLILQLDARGFAVSAGSACTASSTTASHVLRAQGLSEVQAGGSLRISFDDRTDPEDLERFQKTLIDVVEAS